jgi:trehalose 6-phosphate phosphatase
VSARLPASGAGADWSPWLSEPDAAGLLCDYDGTLAPVVDERDKAVPWPGVADLLARLSQRLSVVGVVSGRPFTYLRAHLGSVAGLSLFGLYGLERSAGEVGPAVAAWKDVIALAAAEAERQAPAGVEVENKGLSFTLHVRRRPEMASWAMEWAKKTAGVKGLAVQPGRLSIELLPPVAISKGAVVNELAAGLKALCYIGDDRGDLSAFAALRELRSAGMSTLAVGVASPEQPPELAGAVDLMVEGPAGVLGLLEGLARGSTP